LIKDLTSSTELKAKFKQDPNAVFKTYGIDVPPDIKINVVEDSDKITHWVIPDFSEISDAALETISGGSMPYSDAVRKADQINSWLGFAASIFLAPVLGPADLIGMAQGQRPAESPIDRQAH